MKMKILKYTNILKTYFQIIEGTKNLQKCFKLHPSEMNSWYLEQLVTVHSIKNIH